MKITVKADEALKMLKGVELDLRPQDLLAFVAQEQLEWINANFQGQGTEYVWPPLAPKTRAYKLKHGWSSRPLIRHGVLRRSFDSRASGRNAVAVGTPILYAPFHEDGTRHIPRRKMLPSERLALRMAVKSIERAVRKILRKRGAS